MAWLVRVSAYKAGGPGSNPGGGAGESGKSTIVKQMKILHKGGFTDEERRSFIQVIYNNIRESIVTLIYALSTLKPPESLADPSLISCVEYIRTKATGTVFEFKEEFFDIVKKLWDDEGVQRCFLRANEFQLIDSAKYFLDKIDDIIEPDFLPSDQDIVRTRQKTTGVLQTHFVVRNIHFQ
ncbi:putative guanine nucleotide-binding protein G(s) subunit alpha-like isoform 1 [Apostichopus japonicus]|uniref:Guanine nucleotide-binding protein G(s) subunit alpha n=1 Tax=Stichopus japonicus TaxID=307972 RepID=A0A2G8LDC1_STIJA|nr:putative guanine nucleotide-binding protein G(s) subunit alpha-like isoform 1 [Apostichopus japonicus]